MTTGQMGPVGLLAPSYTWGRGFTDVVAFAAPPAGQAVTHVIPSTYAESVLVACATLTTSAVVANRFPTLALLNGDSKVFATYAASSAIVASSAVTITWSVGPNVAGGAGGAAPAVPLPDLILPPGLRVQLGAVNLDVGDALSGVYMMLAHFPTGPTGAPDRTATLSSTAALYGETT